MDDNKTFMTSLVEFEGWKVPAEFKSNGCTFAPDRINGVSLYPACRLHDFLRRHVVHYGAISASNADKTLKRHLKHLGAPDWAAHIYWLGAKVFRPWFRRTLPVPDLSWLPYVYRKFDMATKIIGINTDFMGFGNNGENRVYIGHTNKTVDNFNNTVNEELSSYVNALSVGDFVILTAVDRVAFLRVATSGAGQISMNDMVPIPTLESRLSALELTAPPDTTPPSNVPSLTATTVSDVEISLSWSAATDLESGIGAYHIYVGASAQPIVVQGNQTSYNHTGLTAETLYEYNIRAINGSGLPSSQLTYASATTAVAATNLPVMTGATVTAVNNQLNPTIADLAATNSPTHYLVTVAEPTSPASSDSRWDTKANWEAGVRNVYAPSYGVPYNFRVWSKNANGVSASPTVLARTMNDTLAPTVPALATCNAISATIIRLFFVASTDDGSGVAGYNIYVNGSGTPSYTGVTTGLFDAVGLTPSTAYTFTVRAVDNAGNESADSNSLGATTMGAGVGVENTSYGTPDYYATATGAGSRNGSQGNEWSYSEAFANAPGGSTVRGEPGTETVAASGDKWTPAFRFANPGTSGNPTVFFARYPKYLNEASPELWTNLRHNGTAVPDFGGPLIGSYGESHVTVDGVNCDENYAMPTADTGPCAINSGSGAVTGVTIRQCGLTGITPTHSTWADAANNGDSENHCGVRIENAYNCTIEDNYITGFRNPRDSHNGAGVMTYANGAHTYGLIIQNNWIDDCAAGVYIKGQVTTSQKWYQSGHRIRRNYITRCTQKGIYLNGCTGTLGGRTEVSQNVIADPIPSVYDGNLNLVSVRFGDEVAHVDVINNSGYKFDNFVDRGTGSVTDCRVRNNIGKEVATGALNRYFYAMFLDTRADMQPDYNCWHATTPAGRFLYLSTSYNTLAAWVSAMGGTYAANDITADPLYVDPDNEDFRIQDTANGIGAGTSPCLNSGVDFLNLKGGGSGAPINMGAYITANQTDVIGPRT